VPVGQAVYSCYWFGSAFRRISSSASTTPVRPPTPATLRLPRLASKGYACAPNSSPMVRPCRVRRSPRRNLELYLASPVRRFARMAVLCTQVKHAG
jgi:hypothetical protein